MAFVCLSEEPDQLNVTSTGANVFMGVVSRKVEGRVCIY